MIEQLTGATGDQAGADEELVRQSAAVQAEPVVSAIPVASGPDGGGYPPISLTVQVQGNASQETVDALGAKAQDIVNMVLDALEERAEDEKR